MQDQQSLRLLNITNPPVIPAQFSEFSVQEEVPLPQTDQFSTLLSSLDGIGMDLEMPGSVTDSWAGDVDFQNAGFGGQPDGPFATDQKMEGLSTIQDDDFEALINFVAW